MCSSFKFNTCMGRNYDYEQSFVEEIRIIKENEFGNKYSIIGMCTGIVEDFPLFYDGMNSQGLCVSALDFSGNARYEYKEGMINVPSYRLPLEILGKFKSVKELVSELDVLNISGEAFSDEFPPSDLHWFVCDMVDSIVLEQTSDGLNWFLGEVMTNNPPYDLQEGNYNILSHIIGEFYPNLDEEYYSRGVNTFNLCGDYTSMGRFERLSYLKEHLFNYGGNLFSDVVSSFHLLASVEQVYGVTPVGDLWEYTIYSVVYDMKNLKVFLKFYDDVSVEEYQL